jgi:hypothetical protein
MTIPTDPQQIWPPIGGGDTSDTEALLAARIFGVRADLSALSLETVRDFHGITGGGGGSTDPDDSELILASQVFAP